MIIQSYRAGGKLRKEARFFTLDYLPIRKQSETNPEVDNIYMKALYPLSGVYFEVGKMEHSKEYLDDGVTDGKFREMEEKLKLFLYANKVFEFFPLKTAAFVHWVMMESDNCDRFDEHIPPELRLLISGFIGKDYTSIDNKKSPRSAFWSFMYRYMILQSSKKSKKEFEILFGDRCRFDRLFNTMTERFGSNVVCVSFTTREHGRCLKVAQVIQQDLGCEYRLISQPKCRCTGNRNSKVFLNGTIESVKLAFSYLLDESCVVEKSIHSNERATVRFIRFDAKVLESAAVWYEKTKFPQSGVCRPLVCGNYGVMFDCEGYKIISFLQRLSSSTSSTSSTSSI